MKLVLFLLLVGSPFLQAVAGEEIIAKVVSVVDGNTIEIDLDNEVQRIVLAEIDCPELSQEFGEEARLFLEKIILKKQVIIKFRGKNRSGDYLAIVMLGDDDVRVDLLREGFAWTSEKTRIRS